MSRCKQCNVEILDETERCPLCHSVLEKTVEVENMYPNVRTMTRRLAFLSRIYLFVAILVEALLIYLNVLSDSEMFWSAIPGLAMLYGYLVLRYAILGKSGMEKALRKAKLPAHVRPVWFSLSDENADVCALSIRQETDGMSFVLEDQEHGTFVVNIPAMGRHNVANALAAYCAATRLGCDAKRVIRGLSNFEQTGRRQKVVDSEGVTVIEDCYNANPDSMKAALAMFKDFPCKRRFALLGDMLELGELSREAHEELGRLAAESGLYCLITYGEQAKRTAVVAAAKGVETLHAENYREAADALLDRVQPGDAVLVKASHGMALEKVLDIFYEEHKEAEV